MAAPARPAEHAAKSLLRRALRRLWTAYAGIYAALCGRHPRLRPWHFQWHALKDLNAALEKTLPSLTGDVLDLGCGASPYRSLLTAADSRTGADIEAGPAVDVVISPGLPLPFAAGRFDAVISTQVLEHVADLDQCLSEIARVLKPGGRLVVSAPFLYHLHGRPHDYRRFSEYGLAQALAGYDMEQVHRQGGVGGTLATLLLGWIETQTGVNVFTWALKALLLPLWIPFCLLVNVAALALDALDTTGSMYHNVLVVARKR